MDPITLIFVPYLYVYGTNIWVNLLGRILEFYRILIDYYDPGRWDPMGSIRQNFEESFIRSINCWEKPSRSDRTGIKSSTVRTTICVRSRPSYCEGLKVVIIIRRDPYFNCNYCWLVLDMLCHSTTGLYSLFIWTKLSLLL